MIFHYKKLYLFLSLIWFHYLFFSYIFMTIKLAQLHRHIFKHVSNFIHALTSQFFLLNF